MSQAMMHAALLSNYQVIDREGTFKVKVAADVKAEDIYVKDDYPRYIIPLRVIKAETLPKLVTLLKTHGKIPFSTIRHYFMTVSLFENDELDPADLPIKGEEVLVTFEYVDDNLLARNVSLLPREELDYVNIEAMDTMYELIKKLSNE